MQNNQRKREEQRTEVKCGYNVTAGFHPAVTYAYNIGIDN